MFVAISSAVCGISDWDQMEMFGKNQITWLRKFFPYHNNIPSHDTINRLFALLDPAEFCKYFTEWTQTLRTDITDEIIAIDGKAVRGSAQKSKGIKSLHFVSAYAAKNQLVLCQQAVDEKSNEITAVPQLLDMIDCKGAIITVDALNTQRQIAAKVIEKGADYIFALKANQEELYGQVLAHFNRLKPSAFNQTLDLGHGRVEKRTCWVIDDLTFVDSAVNWKSMKSIVKIESERFIKATREVQSETRYYISSLSADAKLINESVRQHWSIENKLHWMLDVSFKEDASRKTKDHSTQNYSLICKTALNLIKQQDGKGSYKKQKFNALLDQSERERIMGLS